METQNNFKHTSQLIIKFLKNELSVSEKKEFDIWLNASAENKALVESFRNTESVQSEINYLHNINIEQGWENISKRINRTPLSTFSWNKVFRYSAAAVLFIAIGLIYQYKYPSKEINKTAQVEEIMPGAKKAILRMADGSSIDLNTASFSLKDSDGKLALAANKGVLYFGQNSTANNKGYHIVKTPRSGEYRIVLPDGTKVWLNAVSSLRFPTSFNKTERKVELRGEAYFEVSPNKNLPFRVLFNKTEVEVLGTHFNINSFGGKSKTTLVEGAVKITESGKQELLKPGQEAIVTNGTVDIQTTDTYKSIAWKEGAFYFKEDLLTDIMNQLFRWYDVEIVYKGKPDLKRYSGNIRRQATLNQVLEMLNAVSGTKFSLNERTVTVDFNQNN